MSEALAELGYAPALVLAEDGSGIGAALVAAVALEGGAVRSRQ
jgi:hexokinase